MSVPKTIWLFILGLLGLIVGVCVGAIGFHAIGLWIGAGGLAAIGGHSIAEQNRGIANVKQNAVDSSVQSAERLSAVNSGTAQNAAGSGASTDPDAEIIAEAERLSTANQSTVQGSGNSGSQPGG